jgi:thiamine transport system ATP-binding protein
MDVTVTSLTKRYDRSTPAIAGIDLTFRDGAVTVIVGPSGSGKSTLLNLIAGLLRPTSGHIIFGGRDVTNVPPEHRNIGFVFQSYALFPHLDVEDNVGFGLGRRVTTAERRRIVDEMLELVGISSLRARRPAQLSGGEKQRVAIARALARRPAVLLLDEPLSALDAQLRERLRIELKSLFSSLRTTTIYVTHDRTEAMLLGESVVVMNEGRVLQQAAPELVYREPSNAFVARFFGDANLIEGTIDETGRNVQLPFRAFSIAGPLRLEGSVAALVRPEMFAVDKHAPDLTLRVESSHFIGSRWRVDGTTEHGLQLTVDLNSDRTVKAGESLPLRINRDTLHVLDVESADMAPRFR